MKDSSPKAAAEDLIHRVVRDYSLVAGFEDEIWAAVESVAAESEEDSVPAAAVVAAAAAEMAEAEA